MRHWLQAGAALLLALFAVQALAIAPAETRRIEALIAHVAALPQASFIRNGEAHTPVAAAAHLRLKWGKAGARVNSADEFIALCASRSYFTGKPYLIRFADGRSVEAGPYLRQQLGKR